MSPFTLSDVRTEDESAAVNWNGKRMTVTFNRNAMSYSEYRRLRRLMLAAQDDPKEELPDWLVPTLLQMLTGWDLLENESAKKPVKITEAVLNGLPTLFLLEIMNSIWASLVPNSTPATDSSSSF